MLQPNCRNQLTAEDFGFVVRALARSEGDAVSLQDLLLDEETRDAVLDHDEVFRHLMEQTGCLRVSPALYFYVTTRRTLLRAGLDERTVTDYIASILVAFSDRSRLAAQCDRHRLPREIDASHPYLSDLLALLAKATPEQAYWIRTHIADYSLFVSGLFAERVRARCERNGAPDLSFYENMGRSNYQVASRHRLAQDGPLRAVYERISSEFHGIRLALNTMAENILHLSDPPVPLILHDPAG